MAIGTGSDFVIYDEEFWGGYSEALEQNSDVFNGASNGTITLRPNRLKGNYEKESFVKNIASLVTRRDVTSVSAATDLKVEQDEFVGVKVNRKIGPVSQTLDSWRKIGEDPQTMSYVLGQQIGKAAAVEMADTAIMSAHSAITALSTAGLYDGTAGASTHTGLANILQLMGDAERNIACWVMHSKSYFDLMKDGIDKSSEIIQELAGLTIYNGSTASLGRPVVVVDSSSLIESGTPDQYNILGLTEGAVMVDESETQEIVSDLVTGLENLAMRVQGEYAYNVKIKGFKWDVSNGGANPNDTAIGTSTNWDSVMAAANGIKGGPGARGLFD